MDKVNEHNNKKGLPNNLVETSGTVVVEDIKEMAAAMVLEGKE